MTKLLVAMVILGLLGTTLGMEWEAWQALHNKMYKSQAEQEHRMAIFYQNKQLIEEHNSKDASYKLGLNKFADLTTAEFVSMHSAGAPVEIPMQGIERVEANPSSVNWNCGAAQDSGAMGVVGPMVVTNNIECTYTVETKNIIAVSEQQLIDCVPGDWPAQAYFQYILQAGGLDSESSYPYVAESGQCQFNPANVILKLSSYVNVTTEAALETAVASGPVSVGVDASTWQFYQSGVFNGCTDNSIDHVALTVGYNNAATPYWIVKNTWGSNWGMNGFIWIAKDAGNQCGIGSYGSYPVLSL